jgi:hypothetical protein
MKILILMECIKKRFIFVPEKMLIDSCVTKIKEFSFTEKEEFKENRENYFLVKGSKAQRKVAKT